MVKKVALVLSSGGARGLAHIGVIESLEQNGFEISSISGSSIGAVVGAFYASGHLDAYKEWVVNLDRMDVFKLIDFTFSVQGFIKGERVFKTLESFIPDTQIESMRIPFSAVATDVLGKKEFVFTSGSMYQAIKASVAIPTVIRPVNLDGKALIDGGVLNPLPMEHVCREEGDLLVVSNVNAIIPYQRKEKVEIEENAFYNKKIQGFLNQWNKLLPGGGETTKKTGFFDLLNQSIDLMQNRLTEYALEEHQPDLLINISRESCGTFEFYKAKEIISAGFDAGRQVLDSFNSNKLNF